VRGVYIMIGVADKTPLIGYMVFCEFGWMDGWMDGGLDDWILDGYWMDIGWILDK